MRDQLQISLRQVIEAYEKWSCCPKNHKRNEASVRKIADQSALDAALKKKKYPEKSFGIEQGRRMLTKNMDEFEKGPSIHFFARIEWGFQ